MKLEEMEIVAKFDDCTDFIYIRHDDVKGEFVVTYSEATFDQSTCEVIHSVRTKFSEALQDLTKLLQTNIDNGYYQTGYDII